MKSPVVELKHVFKEYKLGSSRFDALYDVNLAISQGDFISIVGKSGSGKSTLMHLIGCLDVPTKGKIFIEGRDVSNLSESELARIRNKYVGFVFQFFNLLQRTSTLENVMLPTNYSHNGRNAVKEAIRLLELVGLSDKIQNRPNQLSGGQQQRVAIARALINDPNIILADEPTGNLDSKSSWEIMQIFKNLNKEGRTIIVVTHDEDIANQTKRTVRIEDGRII